MADAITMKALQDASLDAKSLEEVVNGDENAVVSTRLGETYPSIKSVIENAKSKLGFITSEADRAEAASDAAFVEANRAETARDAAFVNADVYPDTSAGRAAVADGEQFQVISSDGREIIRYRRINAGNNIEVARYPSVEYFSENRLLNPMRVPDETDFDELKQAGHYLVIDNSAIVSGINLPIQEPGTLRVLRAALSEIVEQSYTSVTGVVFGRRYNGTSWSDWDDGGQAEFIEAAKVARDNRTFIDNNFTQSSNVFPGAEHGLSIDASGQVEADPVRWLSGLIPCAPGETFSISKGSYRISYYRTDSTSYGRMNVDVVGSSSTFTVSLGYSSVAFFRLSSAVSLDAVQLNRGSTFLDYEPFGAMPKYLSENLPKLVVSPEDTTFFNVSGNLFDASSAIHNTSINFGTHAIEQDDLRWLSDFIPTEGETLFSIFPIGVYRFYEFSGDKSYIIGNSISSADTRSLSSPLTKFIRISTSYNTASLDTMQINRGDELQPYQEFGEAKIRPEFLPEVGIQVDIEAIKQEIIEVIEPKYEPSFPTLDFNEISTVPSGGPYWMSADGSVLYGRTNSNERQLVQSTDDWETLVQIGSEDLPLTIQAVRTLDDGELLISTARTKNPEDTYSKVWKTVGYDLNNPSAATFVQVLESTNIDAGFINSWGFSVYQNIVTVLEYGEQGELGAKHVYLSTDYGNTFSLIFDVYTVDAPGRPPVTERVHTHTVAYDPYYNRIWVAVGDHPNTATYYSDDMGQSWTFVEGSTVMQYTGIIALPDAVLFGSDRAPNGVFVYRRKNKHEMPEIKPLLIINDFNTLTHVFKLPFKKDWSPSSPVYFSGATVSNSDLYAPCIVATVDGKKAYKMYEGATGETLEETLGPTASGKIIAVRKNPAGGRDIMRAVAPTWSR